MTDIQPPPDPEFREPAEPTTPDGEPARNPETSDPSSPDTVDDGTAPDRQ